MNKLYSRKQTALRRLAVLAVLVILIQSCGLVYFTPASKLRYIEQELGWEKTETVADRYVIANDGFPLLYRYGLSAGEEGLLLSGMYFHPIAGWEQYSSSALGWDAGASVHARPYNMNPNSDEERVNTIFGWAGSRAAEDLRLRVTFRSWYGVQEPIEEIVTVENFLDWKGERLFWVEVTCPWEYTTAKIEWINGDDPVTLWE